MPAPDRPALEALIAQKIADALFVNGFGERAERLVLKAGDRDLGGWCQGAAERVIREILELAVVLRGSVPPPLQENKEEVDTRVGGKCQPEQPLTAAVNETKSATITPDSKGNDG